MSLTTASPCPTGQHDRHDVYAEACPCRALLDLLANKWSALIIGLLDDGPRRFTQLQAQLPGVGPKMLTRTLRRLEDAGLVSRTVYAEVPPRVDYRLTDLGVSVSDPLAQLRRWVEDHVDQVPVLTSDASL